MDGRNWQQKSPMPLQVERAGFALVVPRPKRPGEWRRRTGRRKEERKKGRKEERKKGREAERVEARNGAGRDKHSPKGGEKRERRRNRRNMGKEWLYFSIQPWTTQNMKKRRGRTKRLTKKKRGQVEDGRQRH